MIETWEFREDLKPIVLHHGNDDNDEKEEDDNNNIFKFKFLSFGN